MLKLRFDLPRGEHGSMLVLFVFVATVLLGFTGLVFDLGLRYTERRQVQNAADEAALAAAYVLYEGGTTSVATAAALEYAQANGYDASQVTLHTPPLAGAYAGDPDYAEVTIEDQPTTAFIHIVTPGGAVRATGVAGAPLFPEPYALVVLEDTDCQAFRQQGGASMTVTGGGVIINSSCGTDALSKTGSGSLLAEGGIDVFGGSSVGGSGTVSPAPRTVPWTVTNPLATLPPPPRTLPPAPGSPGTPENPVTWMHSTSANRTLFPGTYYGGFSSNCACTITFMPGTYVMAGGGFTKAGGANFVGDGVTIYVTTNPTNQLGDGAAKPFNLAGSGALDLSPPTSGLYEGITLWQDEAITASFTMRGSNDLLSGLVYVPGATFDVSGDSTFGAVQLVVNKFLLSGNAPLDLTYGDFRTFEAPKVTLVE